MEEDANAYREVMAAIKLPKTTEQKAARDAALEKATRAATEAPAHGPGDRSGTAEIGTLAEIGNPNALSDVATGAQLAVAALNGARYNVLINLPGINDGAYAQSCRNEVDTLAREAREILSGIDARIR